jgi:site-specific DNA-methyltransferase (adenine-specific)
MPNTNKLIIVGNPPYQKRGKTKRKPAFYHEFIEAGFGLDPIRVCMITPSRWMTTELDSFRNKMKSSKKLKFIKHFDKKIFADVEIKGGVSYFLWDKNHNGLCVVNGKVQDLNKYDIVIIDDKAFSIIDKIDPSKSMKNIVLSYSPFGMMPNFKDWKKRGVNCYTVGRKIKKVHDTDFKDSAKVINKWKVCIAKGGSPMPDKNGKFSPFSYVFIIAPGDICSVTYLVINHFDSKQKAESFASYMKTKTLRYLLKLATSTQNITKDCFIFVPDLEDYTHDWNDVKVCKKLGISDQEYKNIEMLMRDLD